MALGDVDLSYHHYPYRLLFRGAYAQASRFRRTVTLALDIIRNPADLVVLPGYHRMEYWAMLLVCIVLRRPRAVFCDSTRYDRPKTAWREFAKRLFFLRCDGYFGYGIRSKEYLLQYGVATSKIVYGCQAAALPHEYDAAQVLVRYEAARGVRPTHHRFIYVGRLSTEKGLDDLLDAFGAVYAKTSDARLDLVGAGPLGAELEARVSRLNLSHVVTFLGAKNIDEISRLLVESAALVLPSHSEPWGLVVNESLSYGCPVVVSNVCGCVPELVIDGVTGYSFKVGDIEALSTAMLSAVQMSIDRVAVAKRCLDIISRFTPQHAASQLLDGCVRIVGEQR